jgi:hypothetical protein
MSTTSELVKDCELVALSHDDSHERRTAYVLRAAAARLSELERENAALREALKPFAGLWLEADEDQRPSNPFYQRNEAIATYADLRRARAALAGSGEK